jgi:hypothetical protein
MRSFSPQKYDVVTIDLHAALAIGVVCQLLLSLVMRVPVGVGLGVRDWRGGPVTCPSTRPISSLPRCPGGRGANL